MKLFSFRKLRPRDVFADIRKAGDDARNRRDFAEAARRYGEYLALKPEAGDIHVQAGHMFKETRNFEAAERHYVAAVELLPEDADLALQLGHFYKTIGKLERSEAEYRRALDLQPGWAEAERHLALLRSWGWSSSLAKKLAPALLTVDGDNASANDRNLLRMLGREGVLAPELVARTPDQLMHGHHEEIVISRLGRSERSHSGTTRVLRGIEAVRGHVTSELPFDEVVIALNGNIIHRARTRGPYILKFEVNKQRIKKYVFNEWIDFSRFEQGGYLVSVEGIAPGGQSRRFEEYVVIAEPYSFADDPQSDGIIDPAEVAGGDLEERINALPSMVRPVHRTLLPKEPEAILVLRTDQLGDMVASVPAMQRLRRRFPDARITGLLTTGNADFAATTGLFDEILIVDFPDDLMNRRRVMSLADQEKLRQRLAPYRFDLAIDLSDSGVSRPLLLLSGAPKLFGFRDREYSYLVAGQEGNTHDPRNRMEVVGHSAQTVSLITRLEALSAPPPDILRRDDLSPDRLDRFGLAASRPYVLLHGGARIEYSRWPYFEDLARLIIERTGLDVVMMGLEGEARKKLSGALLENDRFRLIEGLLPFDDFDALISFATAFVGNDSGPKHLASLRGVKVVGLHLVRNNWTEWAQEHRGVVVSRRVPCAGCGIYWDAEECGKDFVCLRGITPDEVFDATMGLIGEMPTDPVGDRAG